MVYAAAMIEDWDRQELIAAIANREGTAKQLAKKYGYTVEELRAFVDDNRQAIEAIYNRQVLAEQLASEEGELWIADKSQRLKRYQQVVDKLILMDYTDSTTLREIRSYMALAANELGQLLHRGQGGTSESTVSYSIEGVDMEDLK